MKSKDVKLRRAGPTDFAKVAEMHYRRGGSPWPESWAGLLDVIRQPKMWAHGEVPGGAESVRGGACGSPRPAASCWA